MCHWWKATSLYTKKQLKPIELRAAELDNASSQVDALTFRRKLSFSLNRLLSEKQHQLQSDINNNDNNNIYLDE